MQKSSIINYICRKKPNLLRVDGPEFSLRVLIVDDEEEARDLLQLLLRGAPGITISGLAASVDEAVRLTIEQKPDIVFLDIHMPGKDGFTYLEEIRARNLVPGVIFVTAFENYAIKALRNSAFDYLLKPVNKVELFNAIGRFREMIRENRKTDISELIDLLSKSKPGRLRLNTRTGYFFVDPEDIVYCEADGNYTHIWLTNHRKETSTLNLGNIERSLEDESFLRISRSYIVNMNYVTRVDRKMNQCELEVNDRNYQLRIPSQNIRILEEYFE